MPRLLRAGMLIVVALGLLGSVGGVALAKITPRALTANTTPKVDTTKPYTFTTTGRLYLGDANYMLACSGEVVVSFYRAGNGRKIGQKGALIKPNCTYVVTASNSDNFERNTRVIVKVHFNGNAVISPADAPNQTVIVN